MSVTELETFIDRSLRGLIYGNVALGGRVYDYWQWDGERLASRLIGFDTETELAQPGRIPQLAVAQAFDGEICYLIHPNDLGHFISRHAGANFVGHNIAGFDFLVVYQHLRRVDRKAARTWLAVADAGRIGDTMILDQLIRIARGSFPRERDLATTAAKWCGIENLSKDDPWRLRYGEIIGADWQTVDRQAWDYAAKDAIASRLVYIELRSAARQIVHGNDIDPELIKEHGLLSQRLQVRAAIALAATRNHGLHVDVDLRESVETRLRQELDDCVDRLSDYAEFSGVFVQGRDGELTYTMTGKPRIAQKRLREVLERLAADYEIEPQRSAKTGVVSLSRDFWGQHTEVAPFIATWLELETTAKLIQFFARLQDNHVHPRYVTLVRTGRTSCSGPNIQQMPRSPGFRDIFVARPGHVLLTIDYSALELRTLAAVCESRYGYSILADVIRAGTDPHCYTAALLTGIDLDGFMELKESDPDKFKHHRQAAKAINFGVPGGLGPASLSQYARLTYGVDLSERDAEEFCERFLTEIYPEIDEYLASDLFEVVAQNLMCSVEEVERAFRSDGFLKGAKSIVAGRQQRRDGQPYNEDFIDAVWKNLRELNRNPRLVELIEYEQTGSDLEKKLFFGTVITATGRPRGRATFTQRKNTPFQGMAADGAKIALWELFRAGYRIVTFVHDEFVIELPEGCDYSAEARRVERLCCESMERMTGTVPIACEFALSTCWSKEAETVLDDQGELQIWQPLGRQDAPVSVSRRTSSGM